MIGFLAHNVWWMFALAAAVACGIWPAVVWKFRWPIAVMAVAVLAWMFWLDANALRLQIAKRDAADNKALATAERRARLAEGAAGQSLAIADRAYLRGKTDAKNEFDAVRAGLGDGTVRVRQRFQCPPVDRLPEATGSTGGGDAAAQAGFTAADAGIALGIADEGDDAIRALTLAQATIDAYRAMYGDPPR